MQIAVEVIIDVCHRVIALQGAVPPATSRAALLAEKYRPLVGFRNLLVQEYEQIRLEIVVQIVNQGLGVLADFRDEVLSYVSS